MSLDHNYETEQNDLAAAMVNICKDITCKTQDHITCQSIYKLHHYGFYTSHCIQALMYTNDNLEDAAELLFYKYYGIEHIPRYKNFEILDVLKLSKMRNVEKESLELLCGNAFSEKIPNHVWRLQLQLKYLTNKNIAQEICRNTFKRPMNKLKDTCKILNYMPNNISSNRSSVLEDSIFTLEIRFPKGCKYPYEPPFIYFYQNNGSFPHIKCLRIARRLYNEALHSPEGFPSIYLLMSLLQNENEIKTYLEKNKESFLHPCHLLVREQEEEKRHIDNNCELEPINKIKQENIEENINHRHLESLCIKNQEQKEKNAVSNSYQFESMCTKKQEEAEENIGNSYQESSLATKEEDTINYYQMGPFYIKECKREKKNITNDCQLEIHASRKEKNEENTDNFYPFESLRAKKQEKEEVNVVNCHLKSLLAIQYKDRIDYYQLEPLYENECKIEMENMINDYQLLFLREQEKESENAVNCYQSKPLYEMEKKENENNMINLYQSKLYARGREREEENIINCFLWKPLCEGRQEKTEENMFNCYLSEPLNEIGREREEENISGYYSLELLETAIQYIREQETVNIINFESKPLDVEERERVEETMINQYNQSFSSVMKNEVNIIEFTEYFTEENDVIVQEFINKRKKPKYMKISQERSKLPIWSMRNEILKIILENQVTIICGETGCGKSTQVPQFILDDWIERAILEDIKANSHVNIICTQPRKISATGLADRVAAERIEKVGETAGYHIRLERRMSNKTRLTYCTIGILLQKLMGNPNLLGVTHVVVDEVHERSAESDFLLMLLKDLLPRRPFLKVILMSATLNAEIFSSYFGGVPIINIPGKLFSVEQLFLEDILEKTGYVLEENSKFIRREKRNIEISIDDSDIQRAISSLDFAKESDEDEDLTIEQLINRYPDYSNLTYKNLFLMNHNDINYELIETIVEWIINGKHDYPKTGSILIFLPGMTEIITLIDLLDETLSPKKNKIVIYPLHSSISTEEQNRVFQQTKDGVRKIIISTNLAETSITINDCVFVIDSGKMKENRFNSDKNMECLQSCWVSKANVLQRKGRAGRVMPGVCIHLYTSNRFEYFAAEQTPEILRISLESLLLRIQLMHDGRKVDLHSILSRVLDPPKPKEITNAITRLQDAGAFNSDCVLTPLGHHLAKLPVTVGIGKLILYGAIFNCLDSVLTIAACLSYRNPFYVPFELRERVRNPKFKFLQANSDHLTILKAYTEWQAACRRGKNFGRTFAKQNFLSIYTLNTLADLKYQFLELLVSIGFVSGNLYGRRSNMVDNILTITGPELNMNNQNYKLLQGLICAALYPNIVKLDKHPNQLNAQHLALQTRNNILVKIHPTSAVSQTHFFSSPYLAYQQKLKTKEIFILEVSMIPILPLIIFSSYELNIEHRDGKFTVSLDNGWVTLEVNSFYAGEFLQDMRMDLGILLTQKMQNPLLNLLSCPRSKKIIDRIINVVTNE